MKEFYIEASELRKLKEHKGGKKYPTCEIITVWDKRASQESKEYKLTEVKSCQIKSKKSTKVSS